MYNHKLKKLEKQRQREEEEDEKEEKKEEEEEGGSTKILKKDMRCGYKGQRIREDERLE
jgi:hypothetical protein